MSGHPRRAIVAGGGILGTWHALELAEAGFSVAHLEAEPVLDGRVGAELRSAVGERPLLRRGARGGPAGAPALGGDRRGAAGVGFRARSSLTVACDGAGREVMEAFAGRPEATARSITFLEPDAVRAANPAIRGDITGALLGAEDAVVEPRLALGALR